MLQGTNTAGCGHRQVHGFADGAGYAQVKAVFGAVAVHAGDQQLAGTQLFHLACPAHGFNAGVGFAAVNKDFPAICRSFFNVNGDHNALAAEFLRSFTDEAGIADRRRANGYLAGTRIQQTLHIRHCTHTTANRQRNADGLGNFFHQLDGSVAAFVGGTDIKESQLVGTLLAVAAGDFHRITGITDINEVDALDHTAVFNIQAGDDAFGVAHGVLLHV